MLRLRLFQRDDLTNQIDSRTLDEGEIAIGRDAKADWTVPDPEKAISRRHVVVANRGGLVTLRDTSSNGVFIGDARTRIERDRAVPIERGESIRFGNYVLVVEERQRAAPDGAGTSASPFGEQDNPDGPNEAARPRPPRPFGSTLKTDPLAEGRPIADLDAWESRREAPAGSWEPIAPHRRQDHANMIGAERTWREPPAAPAQEAGYGFDAPFSRPILEQPPIDRDAAAIPSDWMNPAAQSGGSSDDPGPEIGPRVREPILAPSATRDDPAPPIAAETPPAVGPRAPGNYAAEQTDGALLFEHFCAGAGLNPAAFAGEARELVMERLGGVYRQAVLGVAELMRERTALRNEYRMVHTTVRPEGNNPFKWVPPQRIAVELLRSEDSGYTTGERALNEALHEIKGHLLCMLAGMRAALAATFDALAPEQVEARASGRSYLLPMQRDAALWTDYAQLARQLRAEADDSADGTINRAFRQAYEEQAAELNGRQPQR